MGISADPDQMTRRLIRVSTVCVQINFVSFEFEKKNEKNTTQQSKKEGKDQELIQSSTTPDP